MQLFCVKYVTSILALFGHKIKEPSYKRDVGTRGEQLAVKFLKKSGFKILQRNYRCKVGEIDIVCYDHGTIAFVEVKTRHTDSYGPPELSVTEAKKRQIVKVASHYVAEKKIEGIDFRFDVVSIFYSPMKKQPEITLFKNAFSKNDSTPSRI
ncbi:MAG TPA: YraN family protein [Candidatus Wunengus sp. YC60]|uniref:YraN family protein n=1 Tax=Candidatus Wunengus sp. YC60 TaxID=3367697 RepID=UPI004028E66C